MILAVLIFSLLVIMLDHTILNVAMKTIADSEEGLGASQSDLAWAVNSYTLMFAALLFTFGVLGDRFGRKTTLIFGLLLFGLSSLASAYAQDPAQLIAARTLMGIGGAAIMPVTLAIIANVFDPSERGNAIGVWASATGLAVAIGPLVGGVLLEHFWWGSVFLINVVVVAIGLIAVVFIVPESRDPNPGRVDLVGVLLSIAGLILLVYGVITGGGSGRWGDVQVWGAILAGIATLVLFIVYESRIAQPALDIALFRTPRFAAATAAIGLAFFVGLGVMFFAAFYVQLVRGYSPLQAGLLLVPFAIAQLVFAPLSARQVRRYGAHLVCAVGTSLLMFASLAFAFLIDIDTSPWVLAFVFFLMGMGFANIVAPTTEVVVSSVPRSKAGAGSAVGNTSRQVGGALGVAVLGSLLSQVYRDRLNESLSDLPESVRETASESLASTYAVVARLGLDGGVLLPAADQAFIQAMHWAGAVAAIAALAGVFVAFRWLPRRSVEPLRERTGSGQNGRRDSKG